MSEPRLPVVLVGAGSRSAQVYAPLLLGPLSDRLQLCALVSRGRERGQALAEQLAVPLADDLDDAVSRHGARGAIICVSSPENHKLAHQALDLSLPSLLETPLALELDDAAALATRVRESGLPVEVAEQNPRFPTQMFWRRVIEEGFIGTPRLICCDRAGYRYHATAVARSLLGKARGLQASGRRALFPIDIGRGEKEASVYSGTLVSDTGSVFQFSDGEGLYLTNGPWSQGAWSVLADGGSLGNADEIISWRNGEQRKMPVQRCTQLIDGVQTTEKIVLHGEVLLESTSPLPGSALDDDAQAAAQCVLDWLERMDGTPSSSGWSVEDAFADLAWICALERSAMLSGTPVKIRELEK